MVSLVRLDQNRMVIDPGASAELLLTVFAGNSSQYTGYLLIVGTATERLPINITVKQQNGTPVEILALDIELLDPRVFTGEVVKYELNLQNYLSEREFPVTLILSVDTAEPGGSTSGLSKDAKTITDIKTLTVNTTYTLFGEFEIPSYLRPGEYIVSVQANYLGLSSSTSRRFFIIEPFWDYLILGLFSVRWAILAGLIILFGIIVFIWIKRRSAKRKRYVSKVDFNLLPRPGPRSVYIGKIAETEKKAYFDIDQLTMHTLVAGSTGGGKTVSTEVLVEEALQAGIAVIAFDPTAQWTGFLRKCTDVRMLKLYKSFGMKTMDARAFNGNIRQVRNARERIKIADYIKPGEINIFSISQLDPTDSDVLVSNAIREIFHSGLPESPELKLLIIFDEVHRLLPKFGGSGEGFIQLERAVREFRKWGIGLILISQVLTDFVGETKANINTEIQMRTRDQGDLDRIKNKYGGYMLQSLLKASTGTGMVENSAYNRGEPYFIAFKPLMHMHARLEDDVLEKYNKYNDIVDDLAWQLEQLKEYDVDTFDLELDLKLAKDKVKSGTFNMVDIYLEGLAPRVKTHWQKLGKMPRKKEAEIVSDDELQREFELAKKARDNLDGETAKKLEPLKLHNGSTINNVQQLVDSINPMTDGEFAEYVNDQKNEFADWIQTVDPPLATQMRDKKTKIELIDVCEGSLVKK
ncbi:MAG: helicase HerA-like domain-containing protein [archaeon]